MTENVYIQPQWVKANIIEQLMGYSNGALNKMRERGRIVQGTHWKHWNNVVLYNYAAIQEFISNDSQAA